MNSLKQYNKSFFSAYKRKGVNDDHKISPYMYTYNTCKVKNRTGRVAERETEVSTLVDQGLPFSIG